MTIAFQMPLAAHCFVPRRMPLGIKKGPNPSPRRARPRPGIMRRKPPFEVDRPSNIGAIGGLARAAEDIDEAFDHAVVWDHTIAGFSHGI